MECPQCRFNNPPKVTRCTQCNAPLEMVGQTTGGTGGWSDPAPHAEAGGGHGPAAALGPGSVLAGRYEIVQVLGEGGMGAVYKARDRELDRLLAIKVIRPELSGNREILKRFKQELILARKITHKNVIRIYDLGEDQGMKFITMEYIEGHDLRNLLREKGKFSPQEALPLFQQICRALHAAHSEGVVHRDLKPQNVLVDQQGSVTVMDFGIARSMEASGLTRTGAIMGTPEYMSPEQAKGLASDARSDLFSLGIIFYELLTGQAPFQADTALATLLKRTQEPAPPPVKLDPTLPQSLSDLVVKCLEIDLGRRYQSAREILEELEARHGTRTGAVAAVPAGMWPAAIPRKWLAAGITVVVLLLASVGYMIRQKTLRAPAKRETVKLLLADFNNATGDPVFDGTLEPMFTLALEGASFVTSVPRNDARRIAEQLQSGVTKLDESVARLVAVREGISVVVAGSIAREGEGYMVSAQAMDAVTGKTIAGQKIKAADKEKVLATVGKLAAPIRKALGDATPESVQLAAAETFTAASLDAAHSYAVAQELRFAGKGDEAIRQYSRAIELDPNLGSAYAALAAMYANGGQREEGLKYYQMALAKIDRMTDREKYRTRGQYYLAVMNPQKAIEEFSALVKQYPADATGLSNLAFAYYLRLDFAQALGEGRRALEIYPKNVPYRNNVGLYALYAGQFDTATREARRAMELNPSYVKAYVTVALSELARGQPGQAAEIYRRLEALGPRGASLAASGLADLALYEGRLAEARSILEKGVAADMANNNPAAAAKKLATLAEAHLVRGAKAPALAAAERALGGSKELSVLFPAARVYLAVGQEAKARQLASELAKRFEPVPQAYAKLLEGEIQLHSERGDLQAALRLFQEAQKLSDTWLGRLDLGRAYVEAQGYTEAYSEMELCLKRRGEATDVLFDDVPTYRFFPAIYYYLGRAQDGLQSSGGAQSYRTFLSFKPRDEGDPLVADARRRLAGR